MSANDIRDDNLRLVMARAEREYIHIKRDYHRQSLIYCVMTLGGFLFYLMAMPLLLLIFPNSEGVFMAVTGVWGLVAFGAAIMFIPIVFRYFHYVGLMKEHQNFLKRYGRIII